MLNVDNLSFRYSKFSRPVLNGASLELQPGEIGILLGVFVISVLPTVIWTAITARKDGISD